MMLLKFDLETVTYMSEDCAYPEISGYGKQIECSISIEEPSDAAHTTTVEIGEFKFTPGQIEYILTKVKNMQEAAKAYDLSEKQH